MSTNQPHARTALLTNFSRRGAAAGDDRSSLNFFKNNANANSPLTKTSSSATLSRKKIGEDLLNQWSSMDKTESDNTNRLEEVRELVRQGRVSSVVYENLVREDKELKLGIERRQFRDQRAQWTEKPVTQGFLFHRVKGGMFGGFHWKKFYFILYRSKLEWKKKKDAKEPVGSILLDATFDLRDLIPSAAQNVVRISANNAGPAGTSSPIVAQNSNPSTNANANSNRAQLTSDSTIPAAISARKSHASASSVRRNIGSDAGKFKMRNSFELTSLDRSWQFAAESADLKAYWYHCIGITLNRIIEHAKLTDAPVLLTRTPMLTSIPPSIAQKQRDRNYQESVRGSSVRGSQLGSVAGRPMKGSFQAVDIPRRAHGTGIGPTSVKPGSVSTKQVIRVQYVPKQAIIQHEQFSHAATEEEESPPFFEFGETIPLQNIAHPKRSKAELQEREGPVEVLDNELGIKVRSPSFEQNISVTLNELKEKVAKQDAKLSQFKSGQVLATEQVSQLEDDYNEAKKHGDAKEIEDIKRRLTRANDFRIMQDELVAKTNLKRAQLLEALNKKEQELAKALVADEIVDQMVSDSKRKSKVYLDPNPADDSNKNKQATLKKKVQNSTMDPSSAAIKVYERSVQEEKKLLSDLVKLQVAFKDAKLKEDRHVQEEKTAHSLIDTAIDGSVRAEAEEMLSSALRKKEAAKRERNDVETKLNAVKGDLVTTQLKTMELKRLLKQSNKDSFKDNISPTHPPGLSVPMHLAGKGEDQVDSRKALADFIAVNASKANVLVDKNRIADVNPPPKPKANMENVHVPTANVPLKGSKTRLSVFVQQVGQMKLEEEAKKALDEAEGDEDHPVELNEHQQADNEMEKIRKHRPAGAAGPGEYDDYTESFYSDEAPEYPKLDDIKDVDDQGSYFQEKTRNIRAEEKERLAYVYHQEAINQLCNVIKAIGDQTADGKKVVSFQRLFDEYRTISTGLEGTLVRARVDGKIAYEGDFLLISENADTLITLL